MADMALVRQAIGVVAGIMWFVAVTVFVICLTLWAGDLEKRLSAIEASAPLEDRP